MPNWTTYLVETEPDAAFYTCDVRGIDGSLSLVMLNAVKHLGYERRYQAQILRLRLRMTNAKG